MSMGKIYILTVVLLVTSLTGSSQKLIKGIVVDSLSLENLPGVHIKVKHSHHAAVSDASGIFVILANPRDTLTFSFVGYRKSTQLINEEDEIMFVRMRDESIFLKEITIRDSPLFSDKKYIESPTLSTTRPLQASSSGVNFAYFSKMEKEKRKLVARISELERARAYIEIVNDPDVREKIMNNYSISESRYYELLAHFNQTRQDVMYSANSALIINSLFSYFENASYKK